MAEEIEHKYLVHLGLWQPADSGTLYRQGYLSEGKERVVRVRIAGDSAFLTIKGATDGITRLEFEYSIPLDDAADMLDRLCHRPLIEKTRTIARQIYDAADISADASVLKKFEEFERDAAAGTLPDFSFIEPNLIAGHGDYHPALGRALGPHLNLGVDPPSSVLSGEAFLARVYDAYRSATSVRRCNSVPSHTMAACSCSFVRA